MSHQAIIAEAGGWKNQLTTVPELPQSVVSSLKYGGLALKEIAFAFGITSPKANQKLLFFRETGKVLWQMDRCATVSMLMYAVECHREMDDSEMSDKEIEIRRRIQMGKLDRANGNGR